MTGAAPEVAIRVVSSSIAVATEEAYDRNLAIGPGSTISPRKYCRDLYGATSALSTIQIKSATVRIDEAQLPKASQPYDTGERTWTAITIGKWEQRRSKVEKSCDGKSRGRPIACGVVTLRSVRGKVVTKPDASLRCCRVAYGPNKTTSTMPIWSVTGNREGVKNRANSAG